MKKAKAHHAVAKQKAKAKHVVHVKKPTVAHPVVPATSTHTTSLPAEVPPADSGSGMSTQTVLMLTFAVAIGAALLALLAGAGWRRLWWWRRYHSYSGVQRPPVKSNAQGPYRVAAEDAESVTVVTRRGADAPTGT